MYDALYHPNVGLCGFRCRACGALAKSEAGMRKHLWRIHGEKIQEDLFTAGLVQRAGTGKTGGETERDRGSMPEMRAEGHTKKPS